MTSNEIRQQFIDFFRGKQHVIVPSSPVVPFDDPTLLFTNAGMNQFKPIFLGQHAADVDKWQGATPGLPTRAANTQKCIRAGGKHNDLDDVGKDSYHHTFFEMLGNWSFGDYFKKEAIQWAWELLTKVWGIPKERLHATYFGGSAQGSEVGMQGSEVRVQGSAKDTEPQTLNPEPQTLNPSLPPDLESRDLWISLTDIDPSHVHPGNMKDNFWEMGDTGPCGPCSEIHIDLTPDCSGGPLVNAGDARVMEIWNLVFIQFNRGPDGKLTPLPAKHVDTGMGFERLCSVLQGLAHDRLGRFTNYDTDVFTPLFDAIRKRTGAPQYTGTFPRIAGLDTGSLNPKSEIRNPKSSASNTQLMIDSSYRVIADHLRALTFALTDGATPSNDGRGYVLRRILRRAIRFGRQYLNMHEPFICDLVEPLVKHMGDAFPELRTAHGGKNVKHVEEIIRHEEASFLRTLDRGIKHFARARAEAIGGAHARFAGNLVFAGIGAHGGWTEEEIEQSFGTRSVPRLNFVRPSSNEVITLDTDEVEQQLRTANVGICISGKDAFKLHDTDGFPIDLTQQMAEECRLTVDIGEYERLMEAARARARASDITIDQVGQQLLMAALADASKHPPGMDARKYDSDLRCKARIRGGAWGFTPPDRSAHAGQTVILHLDRTPFYAEQGGQVADIGEIKAANGVVKITHVSRHVSEHGDAILHHGTVVSGWIVGLGEECEAIVSHEHRMPTMQNHTATHLLNWALREALCPPDERVNPHVQQKGSLVDPHKTRFDFSHNKALSEEEIEHIEGFVRMQIAADHIVYAASREEDFVDQAAARKVNTLRAVFGEKYPERVRVVSIGAPITEEDARQAGKSDWLLRNPHDAEWMRYSVEFCGGTHVKRTSEIEDFVIVAEEAVAKGVRRVVGVTAQAARDARSLAAALRDRVAALWDAPQAEFHARLTAAQKELADAQLPVLERHKIREQLDQLAEKAKKLEKQKAAASGGAVMDRVAELLALAQQRGDRKEEEGNAECRMPNAECQTDGTSAANALSAFSLQPSAFACVLSGITVIIAEVPPASPDALRSAIDWIRQKTDASAVLLACASEGKVTLLSGMSKSAVDRGLKAGDLIKEVTPLVGGKGGGRPDLAQGGGTDPAGLGKALECAQNWLNSRLT